MSNSIFFNNNLDENQIDHWSENYVESYNLPEWFENLIYVAVDLSILIFIGLIVNKLTKVILLKSLTALFKKTKNKIDDVLLEKKVFNPLAYLGPGLVVIFLSPYILSKHPETTTIVMIVAKVFVTISFLMFVNNLVNALEHLLENNKNFYDKPISSYAQLIKIINYVIGIIFIASFIFNKDVMHILTTLGALTAVIILVFKDTILGFVSSLQISAYDMIHVGDWITIPSYKADGTVIKITLNVVKIKNFDNTISTVPTYAFITDSFQNWKGMSESGVRRMKRSINIKMSSVKFLDQTHLDKLGSYKLIEDYLNEKTRSIDKSNDQELVNINSAKLTNLGTFRVYAEKYLASLDTISSRHTLMVRQLQPTSQGIPLEIYCFIKDTQWVNYEKIQSDVFDHLIASVNAFDLEIFETPTGKDLHHFNLEAQV
ncbi:mechanosensitive ion channel family protein [Aureibacter tunicatorum]|uniref:Miniconductance mechanosensitive channel n=1 Tax=Aureibacter tunicatorum TaxID=866807 RepID=A0AAE3XPK8_9BACT|nr:mechanosensitive ion channel domain-containing protein [Aureibacter tunicatorum]MDR6239611.1 miniconductance mechanosensitive channel [Aureibacter tunicatorum]BDD04088.1 membrane protein [Aureibacter tunicatorum]